MTRTRGDVTEILKRVVSGEPGAANELLPLVEQELRTIAARFLRRESNAQSQQVTALVDDVYLNLIDQHSVDWKDRAHFFALASTGIRRQVEADTPRREPGSRSRGSRRSPGFR